MPADIVIIREQPERLIVHGPGAPAQGIVVVPAPTQILVIRGPGQTALGIAVVREEPERVIVRAPGLQGHHGWTPTLAVALDGTRRVLEVTGWTGGTGTEPATGYVGASGLVEDIGDGVDLATVGSISFIAGAVTEATPATHPSMAIVPPYVWFTIADNQWRKAALSKIS